MRASGDEFYNWQRLISQSVRLISAEVTHKNDILYEYILQTLYMQDRKTTPLKSVWCNIIHWITKFFKGELTKIHCWNTTWMKMLLKSANNNSLLFKTGEWFLKSLIFTVLYRSCFCHKHRWNRCVTIRILPLHQHHHHHICSFGQSSIFY